MNFHPNEDRILVKPESVEKFDVSQTEARRRMAETGRVIATGAGREVNGSILTVSVKEGDVVTFLDSTGCEVLLDGEKFVILQERDILGTITA